MAALKKEYEGRRTKGHKINSERLDEYFDGFRLFDDVEEIRRDRQRMRQRSRHDDEFRAPILENTRDISWGGLFLSAALFSTLFGLGILFLTYLSSDD